MAEVPIYLKVLKIIAWPVTSLVAALAARRFDSQAGTAQTLVAELNELKQMDKVQAKSHAEFEMLHPLPRLKTISLKGD